MAGWINDDACLVIFGCARAKVKSAKLQGQWNNFCQILIALLMIFFFGIDNYEENAWEI